jgi:hypothetical protein
MNTSTRESRARLVRAPWLWLALTYLVLAVGSFVLYGGADYPGLFADSPGALEGGPERDAAIEASRRSPGYSLSVSAGCC